MDSVSVSLPSLRKGVSANVDINFRLDELPAFNKKTSEDDQGDDEEKFDEDYQPIKSLRTQHFKLGA